MWGKNPSVSHGDYAQFIIHRNSVKEDVVIDLFEKHAQNIAPELSFYCNSICYETDKPADENKYWQVYAIHTIQTFLKDDCKMIYGKGKVEDKEL